MNMSLPGTSRPVLFMDSLASVDSNHTVMCLLNDTRYMWAIIASGGWSETDIKYKMIADVYVVLTLCVFGFIGNAITIAVLRKDPDRAISSTNWLLQTLALVDTIYLAARLICNTFNKFFCLTLFLRASAMLKHVLAIGWTSVCLSFCLSVRLSHAGIVSKRLSIYVLSCFLHHTIAHSF